VPSFRKPNFGLSDLMKMAEKMVEEQQRVDDSHLVEEYINVRNLSGGFKTFKAFQQCNKE
ncbi:MAG: hypothetical protein SVY10_01700, partial [Thermodesulfobacteriota bacterium]|nr:hypothetical protein [Thermodesulfobacteriota bacterium]